MTVRIVGLTLAALCFGSFMVGYRLAFSEQRSPSYSLLTLKVAAVASAAAEVIAIATAPSFGAVRFSCGAILFLASLGLFAACVRATAARRLTVAFSANPPEHLVALGPYRLIRHPFYTSYLTAYLAGYVITENLFLLLVLGSMGWIYYRAAMYEERKFGNSLLATEYRRYALTTRMFIPVPRWRALRQSL